MHLFSCCLFVAVILGVQSLTDEDRVRLPEIREECLNKAGLAHKVIPTIQEEQIYSLCFAKKIGLISESGNILTDKVKAKVKKTIKDDHKVSEILKKCAVQKDTPEATGFHLMECLSTEAP
ncbi:hypothetical protein Zmor_020830 [Zophobas morio]|uniref:Uncharacterized protein n=1 Tax=Zophobas morio TaxID=2755281 RepID=A0AA38I4B1_9CUCU|nr:hypothetical protein Zmor_020830 [Zophobas morio]